MANVDTGKIDFVGKGKFFFALSTLVTIAALIIVITKGFKYGIDFAGGVEVQVKFAKTVDTDEIRKLVDTYGMSSPQVQKFGDENEFLIRFEAPEGANEKEINDKTADIINRVTGDLKQLFADKGPEIRRVDSVGPQVGRQLKQDAFLVTFYCLLAILIYVGLRFEVNYGISAIVCLAHDAVVTLGIICLLGMEFNIQILAAVLTIIGYSVNDTIVNFDRVRSTKKAADRMNYWGLVNKAVNDMLGRTILTSLTTFLATLALYLFAGGVIRDFAFAFGVGILMGVYSSIYVSNYVLILLEERSFKRTA